MKALACPNYMAPFDGWVVTVDDRYFKKFVGSQASLDAQLLASLLNQEDKVNGKD